MEVIEVGASPHFCMFPSNAADSQGFQHNLKPATWAKSPKSPKAPKAAKAAKAAKCWKDNLGIQSILQFLQIAVGRIGGRGDRKSVV